MLGIGCDHHGFALKERLRIHLAERGWGVHDFGTSSDAPVDYPDIAAALAEAVAQGTVERGILVCKTGIGMAIVANKVPGVDAATVVDVRTARSARESNDARVIAMGASVVDPVTACAIVDTWLGAVFQAERSAGKLARIRVLERRWRA